MVSFTDYCILPIGDQGQCTLQWGLHMKAGYTVTLRLLISYFALILYLSKQVSRGRCSQSGTDKFDYGCKSHSCSPRGRHKYFCSFKVKRQLLNAWPFTLAAAFSEKQSKFNQASATLLIRLQTWNFSQKDGRVLQYFIIIFFFTNIKFSSVKSAVWQNVTIVMSHENFNIK